MSAYKLQKSITLTNGTEIKELNLDFEALTMADLKTANKISAMINDNGLGTNANVNNVSMSQRLDPNLRIAIAWVAAIKGTQGLMVNDVLKLSMLDAMCLGEEAMTEYLFR